MENGKSIQVESISQTNEVSTCCIKYSKGKKNQNMGNLLRGTLDGYPL